MQPLTNTLSNHCLIDRPLSSHSPGHRWMDLGVSVSPVSQTLLYLPPYSHFPWRWLLSNVKVNELARLCYRMCSSGFFLLLVCCHNLISQAYTHTPTPLPSLCPPVVLQGPRVICSLIDVIKVLLIIKSAPGGEAILGLQFDQCVTC